MVIPQKLISEVLHTRQEATCFLQSVIRHSTVPIRRPNMHLPYISPRVHFFTHSVTAIKITSPYKLLLKQFLEWTKASSTVNFFVLMVLLTQPQSYLWGWDRRDASPPANPSEKIRQIYFVKNHKADACTWLSYRLKKKKGNKKNQPKSERHLLTFQKQKYLTQKSL